MSAAFLRAIEYYLPTTTLSNEELVKRFPDWSAGKIEKKTGIVNRHIARPDECSSDLAFFAAERLLKRNIVDSSAIDFILFCTQTPDFSLPTSACLLQDRLGLPKTVGSLDFNLGCSGYVYGLSLAKGLIESEQARNVLLLTGETYSKLIDPYDRSVVTLFGDAGSATLVCSHSDVTRGDYIGSILAGTDGSGGLNLVCHKGGWRSEGNNASFNKTLKMDGPEIFNFTLRTVPGLIEKILNREALDIDSVDLFIFHQANAYMLQHLRDKIGIPKEKFFISMTNCGNTVSSSIPIALSDADRQGVIKPGNRILLVGFGVGYSWGAVLLRWYLPQSLATRA